MIINTVMFYENYFIEDNVNILKPFLKILVSYFEIQPIESQFN